MVVRSSNVQGVIAPLRRTVAALEPAAPVSNVRLMTDVLAAASARPRFLSLLLGLFSAAAVILSAVGIYGVLAYSVAQRTSEIGIRMAMGASTSQVVAMILREGLITGVVGTVIGAAGAAVLSRFLEGLLFGVSKFDAATFLAMAALLTAIVLLACYIPARRASRVDPMIALRYE